MERVLRLIHGFFGSFRFPIFALTLVVGYEAVLLTLLLLPPGDGQVASFADEFRVWCFGYDPATGSSQWASVLTTFTSPLVMVAVLVAVWFEPLRLVMRQRPTAAIPYATAAAALVIGSSAYLTSLDPRANTGELPFPAQVLRTRITPPDIVLTNQDGQRVSLSDYRGKVVILTAVYASCGFTCPMIMGQGKRVVGALSEDERDDIAIIGVTLDPKTDTPQILSNMAAGQQVSTPVFNLCTGEPDYVERVLDKMGIRRSRDPETGVIDHANLFLLVDRSGHIAYRLTLGKRQERWLQLAIRQLLGEKPTE